jgi:hypothetical protein
MISLAPPERRKTAMPAKHLEYSIRSVVWHGPVVTLDTPQTEPTRPAPGRLPLRAPDHTR